MSYRRAGDFRVWHLADLDCFHGDVRLRGQNGHEIAGLGLPALTDAVEKVENRRTPKISQMVSFGLLRRRDAL
jgi:hypothetical protein